MGTPRGFEPPAKVNLLRLYCCHGTVVPSLPMSDARRARLINFKVSESEYDRIEGLAREHASGNISVWLRRRGMTLSSFPSHFVLLDDDDEGQNEDPANGDANA